MGASVTWDAGRKLIIYALTCDGDHGFLFADRQTFEATGYMAARAAANAAGWRRQLSEGKHYGPCCSNRAISQSQSLG